MNKKSDVVPFGATSVESMTFQDLMDAGVIDIAEVDDTLAVDQSELVGVPFILTSWDVKPSSFGTGDYAVCRVTTPEGKRIFADGGTGIAPTLERYKQIMLDKQIDEFQPIYFHYGLRASHYNKEINGNTVAATTYYFDNRRRP